MKKIHVPIELYKHGGKFGELELLWGHKLKASSVLTGVSSSPQLDKTIEKTKEISCLFRLSKDKLCLHM